MQKKEGAWGRYVYPSLNSYEGCNGLKSLLGYISLSSCCLS